MTAKQIKGGPVLIVEDDTAVREQLRSLMEQAGYRVLAARTWTGARRTLQRAGRPCMVLIDSLIPGADEFARRTALEEGCAVATIPVRLMRTDGEVVKVAGRLEPLVELVRDHCRRVVALVS
jgi:DNA-binding NtrC family response regulator